MSYRDPSLALQDGVYEAIKTLANGHVYYDVPNNAALPYIYFGDDDISPALDSGDFADTTVNIEIFAPDKITLKTLIGQVVDALNQPITIEGFVVLEWFVANSSNRMLEDGLTQQASLEFDYLVAPSE